MAGSFEYAGGAGVSPQFDASVLMVEDCEGANNWVVSGTGTGFGASFVGAAAYFGSFGLEVKTRSALAAADDIVLASRALSLPDFKRLVARGRLCIPDVSTVLEVRVYVYVVSAGSDSLGLVRWTPNAGTVEYWSAAGAWVAIPSLALIPADGDWVEFEAVVDWSAKEFMSVRLAGRESDMGRVGMNAADLGYPEGVSVEFYVKTAGAAQAKVYLDSVYVGSYDVL